MPVIKMHAIRGLLGLIPRKTPFRSQCNIYAQTIAISRRLPGLTDYRNLPVAQGDGALGDKQAYEIENKFII